MKTMGIYLISLEKDFQRRLKLQEQFPYYFSDFRHISAIDGRIIPAIDYFNFTLPFTKYTGRMMSPSELGCTLSHMKTLETFLDSSQDFALILQGKRVSFNQ